MGITWKLILVTLLATSPSTAARIAYGQFGDGCPKTGGTSAALGNIDPVTVDGRLVHFSGLVRVKADCLRPGCLCPCTEGPPLLWVCTACAPFGITDPCQPCSCMNQGNFCDPAKAGIDCGHQSPPYQTAKCQY
jgi:hypothetical protein